MHPARERERRTGLFWGAMESVRLSGTGSRKIQNPKAVPYSQATGSPYCSPPARGIFKPPAAHKRHDTDGRRRQVTKLPKPCPQYPPFHPAVRVYTGSPYLAAHGDTGAASAGLQAHRIVARTFDVIALTDRIRENHLLCLIPVRRQSSRPRLGRLPFSRLRPVGET